MCSWLATDDERCGSRTGLLKANRIVMLGTNGRNGEPQVKALWILYEDGQVKMSINEHPQKLKHLRRDPRASNILVNLENSYKTLEILGTVEIESDPDYVLADRVSKKYGKASMREMDKPGEVRTLGTVIAGKGHTFGKSFQI